MACLCKGAHERLRLGDLFKEGVYEGGEEEMQSAHGAAYRAIFLDGSPVTRHSQQYESYKHPGQMRFRHFEMWPLKVNNPKSYRDPTKVYISEFYYIPLAIP